MTFYFLFIDTH